MAIGKIFIKDSTGAEIDQIEYDDSESADVLNIMSAYGFTREEAVADLKARGKVEGAELNSEERARKLADQIINKSVEGRPDDTYGVGDLEISETQPPKVSEGGSVVPIPAESE